MKKFNLKNLNRKGSMSLPFVIMIMIALTLFIGIFSEYSNMVIIRNIEAASDLAVVEVLRQHVDEESLRDEKLYIPPEEYLQMRKEYLDKVRTSAQQTQFPIYRIEIPEVIDNKVQIPEGYKDDGIFICSDNLFADGSTYTDTSVTFTPKVVLNEKQTAWYLGTSDIKNSSITIVKDYSGLQTSGSRDKTSYIMTVKTTIVYKSMGFLSALSYNFLKYTDIFNDAQPTTTIYTYQVDKGTSIVTIETIGKVTLS